MVKAVLNSIWGRENCCLWHLFPANLDLKPYATLYKSCRPIVHLQVCYLTILNLCTKYFILNQLNRR